MTYEALFQRWTGRYAYSPLGNTGLIREDLPSKKVKGSYKGYTYATAAADDLTIYGGDLTITIDWSDVQMQIRPRLKS